VCTRFSCGSKDNLGENTHNFGNIPKARESDGGYLMRFYVMSPRMLAWIDHWITRYITGSSYCTWDFQRPTGLVGLLLPLDYPAAGNHSLLTSLPLLFLRISPRRICLWQFLTKNSFRFPGLLTTFRGRKSSICPRPRSTNSSFYEYPKSLGKLWGLRGRFIWVKKSTLLV